MSSVDDNWSIRRKKTEEKEKRISTIYDGNWTRDMSHRETRMGAIISGLDSRSSSTSSRHSPQRITNRPEEIELRRYRSSGSIDRVNGYRYRPSYRTSYRTTTPHRSSNKRNRRARLARRVSSLSDIPAVFERHGRRRRRDTSVSSLSDLRQRRARRPQRRHSMSDIYERRTRRPRRGSLGSLNDLRARRTRRPRRASISDIYERRTRHPRRRASLSSLSDLHARRTRRPRRASISDIFERRTRHPRRRTSLSSLSDLHERRERRPRNDSLLDLYIKRQRRRRRSPNRRRRSPKRRRSRSPRRRRSRSPRRRRSRSPRGRRSRSPRDREAKQKARIEHKEERMDARWDTLVDRRERTKELVHELSRDRDDRYKRLMMKRHVRESQFLEADWHEANSPDTVYDLSEHVSMEFQDIFTEPEFYLYHGNRFSEVLGNRTMRVAFNAVYTYVQLGLFYIITLLLGLFISLFWSIIFSLNTFVIVWGVHPLWKLAFTWIRVGGLMYRTIVRIALDPIFSAIGISFTYLRGKFRLHHTGLTSLDKMRADLESGSVSSDSTGSAVNVHLLRDTALQF